MQFTKNGPDVPERLLQAHEDGRVVFFCGAGISYPAGLPGFGELVDAIYTSLKVVPDEVEKVAIKYEKYDTAIDLLENRVGKAAVREVIATILKPKFRRRDATTNQRSIITLARRPDGVCRVVTTNFDRIFERVIETDRLDIKRRAAPYVPVPKNSWDELVYLHGLIPEYPTTRELDRLVVSSADFGLAYLTERWAARFVTELFRNFTVCFVGYSINDPVLRYMMDALAADRQNGEARFEVFAFGDFDAGKEADQRNEWQAKKVTPILYDGRNGHVLLRDTLRKWAAVYRDGVGGKERIVIECAMSRPPIGSNADYLIGRFLWAICDTRGIPAQRFAEFNPAPHLDWLNVLSEARYGHDDLSRFGVPPLKEKNGKLAFSVVSRPVPYTHAAPMVLADSGGFSGWWDQVMHWIAKWLLRHLGDPTLLLFVVERGGHLHPIFHNYLIRRLEHIAELEKNNRLKELAEIRSDSPQAIPAPALRKLWTLVLAGRVYSNRFGRGLFHWRMQFEQFGLTVALRFELRDAIRPRAVIRKPAHYAFSVAATPAPGSVREFVDPEVDVSTDYAGRALAELSKSQRWKVTLPELLDDATLLLRDLFDLLRELEGADDHTDYSFVHQPSISPHHQNRQYKNWTVLIELARDSWTETADIAPARARRVAESWWDTPYPVFKRLAMYAATVRTVIPVGVVVGWLASDQRWCLWSIETQRELLQLLSHLGRVAARGQLSVVEDVILKGPPREMFRPDISGDDWIRLSERTIWLRLAKLSAAGAQLQAVTRDRFNQLSGSHPDWKVAPDEKDEFPFWMGDVQTGAALDTAERPPLRLKDLIAWLQGRRKGTFDDGWSDLCRVDTRRTLVALVWLAKHQQWIADPWGQALYVWSDKAFAHGIWGCLSPVLENSPDDFISEIASPLSLWLGGAAPTIDDSDRIFVPLCERVLDLDHTEAESGRGALIDALNHPIGRVTEALLKWWYRTSPNDGTGLAGDFERLLKKVANVHEARFSPGRVILAANLVPLFRVDPDWTRKWMLPSFDWHNSSEARSVWSGFLSSPRLYRPMIEALQYSLLETASHYTDLNDMRAQYVRLLTFAAIDMPDVFSGARQIAQAINNLPQQGLLQVGRAVVSALEGAGERRQEYWSNKVSIFLTAFWPKDKCRQTQPVSEQLAFVCVQADGSFPDALKRLKRLLVPQPEPHYVILRLGESGLGKRFPKEALSFLNLVVPEHPNFVLEDARTILNTIADSNPRLKKTPEYKRLDTVFKQHELR